jgi:hypothetical protein
MHQLTGLDAAFLTLDSPTAYGHVGNASVLDPPDLITAPLLCHRLFAFRSFGDR